MGVTYITKAFSFERNPFFVCSNFVEKTLFVSEALLELTDRLKGPFNVETVVEPINVQISEAVMIFQEKVQDVATKVRFVLGFYVEKRD